MDNYRFICPYCYEAYDTWDDLQRHICGTGIARRKRNYGGLSDEQMRWIYEGDE